MTSLNNKYTNNRSMNGLINIYADNIEATNSTVNDTLIVDGKDINTVVSQVDINKTNLTGITYTTTPIPTTNITNKVILSNQLSVLGTSTFGGNLNASGPLYAFSDSTFDKNVIVNDGIYGYGATNQLVGSLTTTGNSFFNNNLDVLGNLNVGGQFTANTSIDLTGTLYIRDPSNPTFVYMTVKYDPAQFGFTFTDETPGRIMNFKLKKTSGGYDLFYFASGQLYASMGIYADAWLNVAFNKNLTLGDNNGSVWIGSSMTYIPNSLTTSGLVIYNKGLNNNTAYYTNFTHNDLTNTQVSTFRMNYNNIWSKVPHTMESKLTLLDNLVANTINITPTELSYISGTTSNIQTQLNNKLNTTGGTISGNLTLTGNLIANSTNITPTELSYISGTTSSLQNQLNNKLNTTGGTISGNLTLTGNLIANTITITPTQLSYVSGVTSNIQTQLNNKLGSSGGTVSGNVTINGNLSLPTASTTITFSDSSVQSTAYTTADDTKLQAIGTITTATLNATTTLTSGTVFNCGSMSLTAGTYLISVNCRMDVITGTAVINNMTALYSTSSTTTSQGINSGTIDGGGLTYAIGSAWSLNNTSCVVVSATTTYYMICRYVGTASRVRFVNSNSQFMAVRIA
jgi:hypothetical protein